jgi:hypothetical protein
LARPFSHWAYGPDTDEAQTDRPPPPTHGGDGPWSQRQFGHIIASLWPSRRTCGLHQACTCLVQQSCDVISLIPAITCEAAKADFQAQKADCGTTAATKTKKNAARAVSIAYAWIATACACQFEPYICEPCPKYLHPQRVRVGVNRIRMDCEFRGQATPAPSIFPTRDFWRRAQTRGVQRFALLPSLLG